jgi:WD40 repeat protein
MGYMFPHSFIGFKGYGISCWNNTVAVGSAHRDIVILDAITGSQTAILSGHTDEVNSVVFSSDGRSLVSGSDDKTVKLWDMQTGGAIKTFSGHTELFALFPSQWTVPQLLQGPLMRQSDYGILRQGSVIMS